MIMKWNLKQALRASTASIFGLALFLFTLAASAQTTTSFEVAGSGSAGGEGTIVHAINSAGTMVGVYYDSAENAHAFMQTLGGTDTVIDPPGSTEAEANGINTAGVITGAYTDSAGVGHGFVLATDGTYTTFSAPSAGDAKGQGTRPVGINASGVIAGIYKDSLGVSHGFVRTAKGTITQFDGPDAGTNADEGTFLTILFFSNGPVINNAGEIVGYVVDSGKNHHGFVRATNGTLTEVNAPEAGTAANEGTVLMGVNTAGTIAGYYQDADKDDYGFILATDGTYTDINVGTLKATIVFGINDSGVVTGAFGSKTAGAEGFVRAADGKVTDFIAPDAGDKGNGQGTWPLVVNDSGDVAGLVLDDNQTFAGFIRTP
jgi:hypothetical protein